MSKEVEIKLPKLGESILSATVVNWLKKPGDFVALDEALVEVSTDKVNSEIPSPVSGTLKEILAEVDQEIEVGAPLAIILASEGIEEATVSPPKIECAASSDASMQEYYSPAVLQLARKEGISLSQLEKMKGSGESGRVTKKDIENFVRKKEMPPVSSDHTVSRVKMTGLRKTIAEAMEVAHREIPHATLIQELDVTDVMKFIYAEKEAYFKAHGVKLTLTSFIAKAIASAVVQYPLLNASVDGDTIIVKHSVNLGIAVGVEHGVIVPVVKFCERKNVATLAKEIQDLAERTRSNKLLPDDVQEGTITLTNFGMTGIKTGFPIIRPPEVAIIGIGSVQKRVHVMPDDSIAIRQMLDLTLSFDHRVMDGLYSCGFVNALRTCFKISAMSDF